MNINTQTKKKISKRKYEGDENQHLHHSKSQKLIRERNRKAKLRKNPAMSIFEAGRERTKRIIKKEYPSINLNKPPSSIASLSNYTPRNKKIEEKTNKNDKDHKSTVYKRTTFRLPIREPSAQNFDMYYYLAPNQEPATVTNILELYDEIKSKLIEKKKAKVFCTNKLIISKEPILKNKDNYINITNNKTNLLSASTKLSKTSLPLSNKENHPSHQKKMGKENKGILTKSNMNNSNILKPSTKIDNLKEGKTNSIKSELDDNKENIPPLHHNQNATTLNLQFIDYPSGNGTVGLTSIAKPNTDQEKKKDNKIKLNEITKEDKNKENIKEEKDKENIKENVKENKPTQKKSKPIIINTVSDEDLEEFFRVFDDLIPMYRSSTQLQEVIFETSQKEWNEWCYKVEQCEEETNTWLDARIMFYSRRIIEYQKDWAEYWNKKQKKEKETLKLTSDLSSDGLCPNTPSSTSFLSESIKLLGSSPLPSFPLISPSSIFNMPFQTPDDSITSMITNNETTPTKSATISADSISSNATLSNIFMNNNDLDLTSFSMDSNQDLLSNMSLLYDTTTNSQSGYPNMEYNLDSSSSFDPLDPLSSTTLNNDYNNWLSSNPSSSLSMDDIIFNTTVPSDSNVSLLINPLQPSTNATEIDANSSSSLNLLNPVAGTTASLNPTLSIFDTNYTTSSSDYNLFIPPSSLDKLPSVSSTASLIDSFTNLNADDDNDEEKSTISKSIAIKKETIDSNSRNDIKIINQDNENKNENENKNVNENKNYSKIKLSASTQEITETLTKKFEQEKIKDSTPIMTSTTTDTTKANEDITKADETPKMTVKMVTDPLITPTKSNKKCNPGNVLIDSAFTNDIKNNFEFATPLHIKPPIMNKLSSIPKSYQEMYNDKMCSLISTLERCVQDKEDFWKVMEEFTSSINK
jgi:hypothetical protein